MNRLQLIVLILICHRASFAQIGGSQSLDFTNTAVNAGVFAIGGVDVSHRDLDNNHFWQNPASLDTGFNNFISYNYNANYADIQNHTLSYTKSKEKLGNFAFGISFWNYGEMQETDENGNEIGEFRASDLILNIGYGRRFDNFSYGLNLKIANSSIASFNSTALLFDLGGQFIHPKEDFVIGMVFRNIGMPLSKYTSDTEFVLPFDLRIGSSYKPKHMPLRFSATLHRLYRYDIVYDDPNLFTGFDENGEPIREEPGTLDKLTRHLIIGTELLITKGFNIQAGYNFMRRAELQIVERKALVGFSFGMLLKVKSVQFALARSVDHISGATTKLTLTSDLNFITKNRI
ncbi:MAG: type IX secretion system protein PorQ [Cytophagales bacterium]